MLGLQSAGGANGRASSAKIIPQRAVIGREIAPNISSALANWSTAADLQEHNHQVETATEIGAFPSSFSLPHNRPRPQAPSLLSNHPMDFDRVNKLNLFAFWVRLHCLHYRVVLGFALPHLLQQCLPELRLIVAQALNFIPSLLVEEGDDRLAYVEIAGDAQLIRTAHSFT